MCVCVCVCVCVSLCVCSVCVCVCMSVCVSLCEYVCSVCVSVSVSACVMCAVPRFDEDDSIDEEYQTAVKSPAVTTRSLKMTKFEKIASSWLTDPPTPPTQYYTEIQASCVLP